MFYNSQLRLVLLAYVAVMVLFILLLNDFEKKKTLEYKNDERWQTIKIHVYKIINNYYNILTMLVCIAMVAFSLFHWNFDLQLEDILLYAFFILMLKIPVEYLALRYYDKAL